jgi:hypothetical protein
MTGKPTLHVIDGTAKDDDNRQKARKVMQKRPQAACLLRCHRCGGGEVFETKVGMIYKGGKASGGTKQILCASCFMKGERVVLC